MTDREAYQQALDELVSARRRVGEAYQLLLNRAVVTDGHAGKALEHLDAATAALAKALGDTTPRRETCKP